MRQEKDRARAIELLKMGMRGAELADCLGANQITVGPIIYSDAELSAAARQGDDLAVRLFKEHGGIKKLARRLHRNEHLLRRLIGGDYSCYVPKWNGRPEDTAMNRLLMEKWAR